MWEILKAPIMATVKLTGLMPGIPTIDTRFLFYITVIIPFLPIYLYSKTFEDDSIYMLIFFYFLFYLTFTIIMGQLIKKIGKRWSEEEYEKLTPDQVTFPFILVMILNASFHFGIYYFISKLAY